MKKLSVGAMVVAAAIGVYLWRAAPSNGPRDSQSAAIANTSPDAERTFARLRGLEESSRRLRAAGYATLAESVDGYHQRALEHLERGEVERAADIAGSGESLAQQVLGPPAAAPQTAAATPAASDPPQPAAGSGGGSVMTEQMAVVDMVGTLHGGDTQPTIRGARTKARAAAAAAQAASRSALEDELQD